MKTGIKIISLLAALLLAAGCSSVKYVPVETVRNDTTYISQLRVDSIYSRDSVFVEHKGDTVWLEKYRYIYKYKVQTDTLWHERTDTISVPYPVEKQLTQWQKAKMGLGSAFAALIILGALVGAVWLAVKKLF